MFLAEIANARGDFTKARALRLAIILRSDDQTACLKTPKVSLPIYLQGAVGGDAAQSANALAVVNECLAAKPATVPLWAALGLMHFGQTQRALQVIAQGPTTDDAGLFNYFWSPQRRAMRTAREFSEFARKVGLADVWDRYGPPDGCQRKASGDYVCE